VSKFHELLTECCKLIASGCITFFVDGTDDLDTCHQARSLSWLPEKIPEVSGCQWRFLILCVIYMTSPIAFSQWWLFNEHIIEIITRYLSKRNIPVVNTLGIVDPECLGELCWLRAVNHWPKTYIISLPLQPAPSLERLWKQSRRWFGIRKTPRLQKYALQGVTG